MTNPPPIAPLRTAIARPFWSVMIPVYNRTEYLAETLRSVLAQDPGPDQMQIAVVDDCSTEADPATVLEEVDASKRIRLIRLSRHISISHAWNACIEHSLGRWVHILHSDDIVLPGFYDSLQKGLNEQPDAGLACCRTAWINDSGRRTREALPEQTFAGLLTQEALNHLVIASTIPCPSAVVKRAVYENLGGFRNDLFYALDWEMWRRIALHYPAWYDPHILCYWRTHSKSATATLILDSRTLTDTRKSIEIIREHLPKNMAWLSRKAVIESAFEGIWQSRRMLRAGRYMEVCRSVRMAFEHTCLEPSLPFARAKSGLRLLVESPRFLTRRFVLGVRARWLRQRVAP